MAGSAARVVITERQQEVLLRLSTAGTVARRLGQRARVILLAFAGLDNEAIARRVGLERHQVGTWRRRWQRAFDKLVRIECLETSAALRRAVEAVLTDDPRPGCPGKFTAEQLALILAVACEPPEGPTRTEEDFVGHIEKTVRLDPDAGYVFVVDNLNIHQSAGLVGLVSRLCGIEGDLGKKGVRGVLKSMKTRQQFLSDLGNR